MKEHNTYEKLGAFAIRRKKNTHYIGRWLGPGCGGVHPYLSPAQSLVEVVAVGSLISWLSWHHGVINTKFRHSIAWS